MCAGAHEFDFVGVVAIDQQPIRLDVAIAITLPAPLERVIPVNRRQQFAHHRLPRSRLTDAWAISFQSQALRIPDTDSSKGRS
jgi:hypothetical protein